MKKKNTEGLDNIAEIEFLKKQIDNTLKIEKRAEAKRFRKTNRKWFIAMDILIILMFMSNIGAMLITNALVVKATPEVKLYEANPVQTEMRDYAEVPQEQRQEATDGLNTFVITCVFYAIIITFYLLSRFYCYTYLRMWSLLFFVIFYAIALHLDFINDLGFLVGKFIWG